MHSMQKPSIVRSWMPSTPNSNREFINRLDELVVFDPLTRDELGSIVDIQVAQVAKRLTDRRISLDGERGGSGMAG
jgi:ATP-dependent Clp protease ATP-binding subunit ClpA